MKIGQLLVFTLILIVSACSSGKKAYERGDYYGAVMKAINRLRQQRVDGIIVVDSDGIVRFANPAACAIFGHPVGDLVGFHLGVPAIHDQATAG